MIIEIPDIKDSKIGRAIIEWLTARGLELTPAPWGTFRIDKNNYYFIHEVKCTAEDKLAFILTFPECNAE